MIALGPWGHVAIVAGLAVVGVLTFIGVLGAWPWRKRSALDEANRRWRR